MEAVKRGGDRQELHEAIRRIALEAQEQVAEARPNDVLERAKAHPALGAAASAVEARLDPARFIGLCVEQVTRFLAEHVDPVLARFSGREDRGRGPGVARADHRCAGRCRLKPAVRG